MVRLLNVWRCVVIQNNDYMDIQSRYYVYFSPFALSPFHTTVNFASTQTLMILL